MLLRLLVLLLLVFSVATPAAYAADAGTDETCAEEVRDAQEERSVAVTQASNEVYNDTVEGIAPTGGLTCMDKIMGDWSRIGSIFSDTGDLDKKLFDHAKTFAIPFLANYLAGQFDIGGFTFSFDFTSLLNEAIGGIGDAIGIGGGGGFGPAFSGCDDLNDYLEGVKEKGLEETGIKDAQSKLGKAFKKGILKNVKINGG